MTMTQSGTLVLAQPEKHFTYFSFFLHVLVLLLARDASEQPRGITGRWIISCRLSSGATVQYTAMHGKRKGRKHERHSNTSEGSRYSTMYSAYMDMVTHRIVSTSQSSIDCTAGDTHELPSSRVAGATRAKYAMPKHGMTIFDETS